MGVSSLTKILGQVTLESGRAWSESRFVVAQLRGVGPGRMILVHVRMHIGVYLGLTFIIKFHSIEPFYQPFG